MKLSVDCIKKFKRRDLILIISNENVHLKHYGISFNFDFLIAWIANMCDLNINDVTFRRNFWYHHDLLLFHPLRRYKMSEVNASNVQSERMNISFMFEKWISAGCFHTSWTHIFKVHEASSKIVAINYFFVPSSFSFYASLKKFLLYLDKTIFSTNYVMKLFKTKKRKNNLQSFCRLVRDTI